MSASVIIKGSGRGSRKGWAPSPVHMLPRLHLCHGMMGRDALAVYGPLDLALASRTIGSSFLLFVNYCMSGIFLEQHKTGKDCGRAEGFLRSNCSFPKQGKRVILEQIIDSDCHCCGSL